MFSAMLLADQGLDLGIYDARMTLQKNNSIGLADPAGDDPGMGVYTPAIVGAMNGPFKEKMGIPFNRRYIYRCRGLPCWYCQC